jgi:hypothetical protein
VCKNPTRLTMSLLPVLIVVLVLLVVAGFLANRRKEN